MELAAADAMYKQIHEDRPFHDGTFNGWSEKRTAFAPYHFEDGVHLYVAEFDVNPDDDFLKAPDVFPTSAGASRLDNDTE